ncbi:MAG: hypothetical protein AAGA56_11530 [Myxococcota bacterium]
MIAAVLAAPRCGSVDEIRLVLGLHYLQGAKVDVRTDDVVVREF